MVKIGTLLEVYTVGGPKRCAIAGLTGMLAMPGVAYLHRSFKHWTLGDLTAQWNSVRPSGSCALMSAPYLWESNEGWFLHAR